MNDNSLCGQAARPIDHDALLKRCMGRVDLMQKIVETYLVRVGDDIQTLVKAIELENTPEIARLAHKLKGSSLTVSARDLAETAGAIETLVEASLNESLPAMAHKLEAAQSRLVEFARLDLGVGGDG